MKDQLLRYLDHRESGVSVLVNPEVHKSGKFNGPFGQIEIIALDCIPKTHIVWISDTKIKKYKIGEIKCHSMK
jgi:hypothetical protein